MNKEIEELLNDLKNTADTSFFAVCGSEEELKKMPRGVCNFLTLNDKKAKLLLSYIEQLEKRNKELYEGFMATQKELTDYATENEQLENNRDKAIEIINIEKSEMGYAKYDSCLLLIEEALKGDSDEQE